VSGKLFFAKIEIMMYFCIKNCAMTTTFSVYDQIAEFMAGMDPHKMIRFTASPENQMRLDTLLSKQREQALTVEERTELEHYLIINRIVGLAKARAKYNLDL
jgi:hypothetical protein